MVVAHGRLRPRGSVSRLRLRTLLAETGLQGVNPLREDVFLQIREGDGPEMLCAKMPAEKFARLHRVFRFADRKHRVTGAEGIDRLTIRVRRDGSVRMRTVGRRVQTPTPEHGPLQITVGFYDPASDGPGRCSTTMQAFRAGARGRLVTP